MHKLLRHLVMLLLVRHDRRNELLRPGVLGHEELTPMVHVTHQANVPESVERLLVRCPGLLGGLLPLVGRPLFRGGQVLVVLRVDVEGDLLGRLVDQILLGVVGDHHSRNL